MGARVFGEPLVSVGSAPSPRQNRELGEALRLHVQRAERDDFSAMEQFAARNPGSPWTAAVLFNLGLEYYDTGWYSKALGAWEKAWPLLKDANDPAPKALADRAAGELAFMYARLGRMGELSALLTSIEGRVLRGPGAEKVAGARQGLWTMQHQPEISFRCGPLALDRIIAYQNPGKGGQLLIQNSSSTTNGFSLSQVALLSQQVGLNYQMAYRTKGAPFVVPAVVNWKVGHYAALVREQDGLYLLQDPTFRNDAWVSRRALEEETSGYFLVPPGKLPDGWRGVSESEGMTVWGKGTTSSSEPNATTPNDKKNCPGGGPGMAVSSVHLLDVSLNIEDNPVGYAPPVGPAVRFVVNYNQRESDQPAIFSYSNLGAQWTFNFLAFITDDPLAPNNNVNYYTDGGGTLPFTGFNPATQSFTPQIKSQAVLTRLSTSSYQMLYPDGSKLVFAQPDSTNTTSRRVFMTQIVDPYGNSLQISYDTQFRVVAITDAIGQVTTLSYTSTDPLKITQVTDPFGRHASFQYDSANRLSQITDCVGLTSQFTYDAGDNILGMTTPYGTTSYAFGQSGRDTWLETTYPNGEKDRVEYSESTTVGIDTQDPASTLPQGMWTRDWVVYARNTYFWDRNAYHTYAANPQDYSKAYVYHWLHDASLSTAMGVLESVKPPLENRTWYNYQGQPAGNYYATIIGAINQPSVIGRVLDDGTTQLRKFTYNTLGRVTSSIDPVGRSTTNVYSTNFVDLLEIHQTTGTNNDLLARVVYNSQHLPVAVFDSSGQMTTNTYNARGQLLTTTDPLGETTSMSYDPNGFLLTVTGPLGGMNDTVGYSYDTVGRMRALTNADGYVLTYAYDNLDRVTNITYPDGTFEAFTYSNLDLVIARDRLGRQTISTYDALRRRVAVQDPLGRVTSFEYCGCGSMSALIDPMGRKTTWEHDIEGRLAAKVYADGSRVSYNYENTTSRVKSVVDEKGQYKLFSYNLDDSISSVSYPNATVPTPTVSYTYDPNYARAATMQDGVGTIVYTYNPVTTTPAVGAGKLASISGPLPSSTVTYQYDALGRVVNRSINGVAQATSYDALGRPMLITNELGTFQYAYAGGTTRLLSEAYPNGQTNIYSYYSAVGDDRLEQIQHLKPNGSLLSGSGFAYNALGQIVAWTNQWDTLAPRIWAVGYDSVDQVTNIGSSSGTNFTYTYDLSGNRLSASSNGAVSQAYYNALNQLLSSSSSAPTNSTYEWDAEDRLTAINTGAHRSEFNYDGASRCVEIVEKTNGIVVTTAFYLWSGNEISEVRDSTGSNVLRRVFSQGESLAGGGSSTNYFYTKDHLGSVREATDSQGQLATRYDYDPYGAQIVYQQNVATTAGYGHLYPHAFSGLLLSRYRVYNPALGRWLSRDAAGELGGLNLYDYAGNNPIVFTDPLGLYSWGQFFSDVGTGLVGAGIGIAAVALLPEEAVGGLALLGLYGLYNAGQTLLNPCVPTDTKISLGVQLGTGFLAGGLASGLLGGEASGTTSGGIGPVLQGQRGVAQAIAQIESEGGTVLGSEITVDAGGVRARPDLLVQNADGSLNFVEVKTGGGQLTPNQQAVYPLIEQGGAVPAGANAANAGLEPGVPLPPTPVRIIRYP
jgi:RHS repeat-associated protein